MNPIIKSALLSILKSVLTAALTVLGVTASGCVPFYTHTLYV